VREVRIRKGKVIQRVTYSIFCSDVPIPVKCDSMAAAIDTACKLMSGGASVFQIVGSDGFMMERRDIEIECLRRRKGNPQIKT
jgi:pantothenate kinase